MSNTIKREWLADARRSKNLTQAQLASKAGLCEMSIKSFELGLRTPTPATAQKLSAILEIDWTRFYPNPNLSV